MAVLFADLQGFTSLSEQQDPEDVATFLDALFRDFSAVIERYGGYIDKYIGDAVMALFGAPVAHEDDIEHAVRAGLELVRVSRSVRHPFGEDLRIRVGIHYGEVVAGMLGAGEGADYTVTGDTANTAARLQSAAPLNSVLVTERVYRTIRPIVHARPLEPLDLKGKQSPVGARVVESIEPRSRRYSTRSPFVGRILERERLEAAARSTHESQGMVLLVEGEAGIGKSRLVQEFAESLVFKGWRFLVGRCVPMEGQPFGPFRSILRAAMTDGSPGDGSSSVESVARQWMGSDDPDLLREVLSLAGEDALDSPQESSDRVHAIRGLAVERVLKFLAGESRTVILVEDLHWADADTRDLLEDLAHRVDRTGVLLLLTTRPPVEEVLSPSCCATIDRIQLCSLGSGPCEILAGALARRVGIEASDLASRSGGNPLFLEELVAAAAEHVEELPDSIHSLIQSRLDRLPPGPRSAMRYGAVLGVDFPREALQVLHSRATRAPGFEADVDFLLERELLIQPDDDMLSFRHALVREVAYETELKSERRRMHSWAAEAIEESSTDDADIEPLLAHHYSEAEEWERAFPHLLAAGHGALAQYAIREAGKWLEKASSALEHKGVSPDSLTAAQLWQDLAESRLYRADLPSALDASDKLTLAAEEMESPVLIARAHLLRGHIFWNQDNPDAARSEFERGLSIVPLTARVERAELLNASGVAASLGNRDTERGEARLREALGLWAQLGDRLGQAKASVNLGNLMVARERLDEARSWYERTLEIGRAIPDRMVVVINLADRGMVQYWSGDYAGAERSFRESQTLAEELGLRQHSIRITENLGRCYLAEGNLRRAVECFDVCLRSCEETGSPRGWALLYLGRSYFAAMDTSRARHFWGECRSEIAHQQDSEIEAELALDEGRLAWLERDLDLAEDRLRTALKRAEEDRNAPLAYAVRGFIWLVNAQKSEPPPTEANVGERRPLAALLGFQAGRALLVCGRSGPALERLLTATKIVDAIGADRLGRHAHFVTYQAALNVGVEELAKHHLDRTRELTRRMLNRLPSDVSVSSYRECLPPELRDLKASLATLTNPS